MASFEREKNNLVRKRIEYFIDKVKIIHQIEFKIQALVALYNGVTIIPNIKNIHIRNDMNSVDAK